MTLSWKLVSTGLLAVALSAGVATLSTPGGAGVLADARAEVPLGDPVFTDPMEITNDYFPFQAGAIKVHTGREGNIDLTVVEFHLMETRTFQWNGQDIECRVIRESAFVDGELAQTSWNYFAQADDGSVYSFGEIAQENLLDGDDDEEDDGEDDDPDVSWVVGVVAETDPPETVSTEDPFVEMPAVPEVGDTWSPENVPGAQYETFEVTRVTKRLRVPAGRFVDCLQIVDTGASGSREQRWYAPGIGFVKSRSKGESSRLLASTLGSR